MLKVFLLALFLHGSSAFSQNKPTPANAQKTTRAMDMANALKKSLRSTAGIDQRKLANYDRWIDEYQRASATARSKEEEKSHWLTLMKKMDLPIPVNQDWMKKAVFEIVTSKPYQLPR